MDIVGAFIAEMCDVGKKKRVKRTGLYVAYVAWCEEACYKPVDKKEFHQLMLQKGFEDKKSGGHIWLGLSLRGQAAQGRLSSLFTDGSKVA